MNLNNDNSNINNNPLSINKDSLEYWKRANFDFEHQKTNLLIEWNDYNISLIEFNVNNFVKENEFNISVLKLKTLKIKFAIDSFQAFNVGNYYDNFFFTNKFNRLNFKYFILNKAIEKIEQLNQWKILYSDLFLTNDQINDKVGNLSNVLETYELLERVELALDNDLFPNHLALQISQLKRLKRKLKHKYTELKRSELFRNFSNLFEHIDNNYINIDITNNVQLNQEIDNVRLAKNLLYQNNEIVLSKYFLKLKRYLSQLEQKKENFTNWKTHYEQKTAQINLILYDNNILIYCDKLKNSLNIYNQLIDEANELQIINLIPREINFLNSKVEELSPKYAEALKFQNWLNINNDFIYNDFIDFAFDSTSDNFEERIDNIIDTINQLIYEVNSSTWNHLATPQITKLNELKDKFKICKRNLLHIRDIYFDLPLEFINLNFKDIFINSYIHDENFLSIKKTELKKHIKNFNKVLNYENIVLTNIKEDIRILKNNKTILNNLTRELLYIQNWINQYGTDSLTLINTQDITANESRLKILKVKQNLMNKIMDSIQPENNFNYLIYSYKSTLSSNLKAVNDRIEKIESFNKFKNVIQSQYAFFITKNHINNYDDVNAIEENIEIININFKYFEGIRDTFINSDNTFNKAQHLLEIFKARYKELNRATESYNYPIIDYPSTSNANTSLSSWNVSEDIKSESTVLIFPIIIIAISFAYLIKKIMKKMKK